MNNKKIITVLQVQLNIIKAFKEPMDLCGGGDGVNITAHQAELIIQLLSENKITEGELCEICKENEAKVIYKVCYPCEEHIINGKHY